MQYSLKKLFYGVAAIAIAVAFANHLYRTSLVEIDESFSVWPAPISDLIGSNRLLREDVKVFGALLPGFEHSAIIIIRDQPELVSKLIKQHGLVLASRKHPLSKRLSVPLPTHFKRPNLSSSVWYATPGFGSTHLEGQDLFLIAYDEKTSVAIILHEWVL